MWPSRAATKQTRPPLKKVPLSEPKAESAAARDMIQPQLPSTLFLREKKEPLSDSLLRFHCRCLTPRSLPLRWKTSVLWASSPSGSWCSPANTSPSPGRWQWQLPGADSPWWQKSHQRYTTDTQNVEKQTSKRKDKIAVFELLARKTKIGKFTKKNFKNTNQYYNNLLIFIIF